ncbi:FAS1 domain-containing protein-like protein [Salvia divinorum]|uniref:FAS1 domain-containing protein-like protein n=1 Tax=Salvia divinorum TaxID=28513 RepID=A0ABD1G5P0_SALDI
MAILFSLSLLLVALTAAAAASTLSPTSAAEAQPPSPHATPLAPPPSPSPKPTAEANQETHLRNILDALVGSGDYGGWANLLSSANPSDLPLTATLFAPSNDAISAAAARLDPLLVAYHIVPQRLTFSQLRRLNNRTRLPTLLPSNTIVVSENSPEKFTVDGSQITQGDIFLNSAFAVHGVDRVLNYSVFGGGDRSPISLAPESDGDGDGAGLEGEKQKRPPRPRPRPPRPPRPRPPPSPGSGGGELPDIPDIAAPGPKAGAWRSCTGIPVVVSCFFVFFAFMIR